VNFPRLLAAISARARRLLTARDVLGVALITVFSSPAWAQFEKGTEGLNSVKTWLMSIGGVIFTFAIMFVGIRMMFNAAQWKDVAPVFWGGCLLGGAVTFSSLFF
jgi:type IV secretion system protein VirB2